MNWVIPNVIFFALIVISNVFCKTLYANWLYKYVLDKRLTKSDYLPVVRKDPTRKSFPSF